MSRKAVAAFSLAVAGVSVTPVLAATANADTVAQNVVKQWQLPAVSSVDAAHTDHKLSGVKYKVVVEERKDVSSPWVNVTEQQKTDDKETSEQKNDVVLQAQKLIDEDATTPGADEEHSLTRVTYTEETAASGFELNHDDVTLYRVTDGFVQDVPKDDTAKISTDDVKFIPAQINDDNSKVLKEGSVQFVDDAVISTSSSITSPSAPSSETVSTPAVSVAAATAAISTVSPTTMASPSSTSPTTSNSVESESASSTSSVSPTVTASPSSVVSKTSSQTSPVSSSTVESKTVKKDVTSSSNSVPSSTVVKKSSGVKSSTSKNVSASSAVKDAGKVVLPVTGVDSTSGYSIDGSVFYDANHNGAYDSKESPAAKRTVTLKSDSDQSVVAMRTTDANGHYSFKGLELGTYDVYVQNSGSSEVTSVWGNTAADHAVVILNDQMTQSTVDFGVSGAGSPSGSGDATISGGSTPTAPTLNSGSSTPSSSSTTPTSSPSSTTPNTYVETQKQVVSTTTTSTPPYTYTAVNSGEVPNTVNEAALFAGFSSLVMAGGLACLGLRRDR